MAKFPFHVLMDEASSEGGASGNAPSAETIERATELGWVPEDKWTGPKAKWVDAASFVERGEEILPIVKAQKRALETKVRELTTTLAGINKEVVEFREFTQKAAETKYKRELAAALESKAQAIEDGKGAEAVAADQEIARLNEERAEAERKAKATTQTQTPTDQHPDYAGWLAENPWYVEDVDLQASANIVAYAVAKKNPTLAGRPFFEEIKKQLKRQEVWKEKFPEDSTMARGNTVEGAQENGNRRPTGNAKDHTYANLPADAKKACDGFAEKGWLPGKTLEEKRKAYCDEYDWS